MQIDADTPMVPTRHWHRLADGRLQCDVCPRECKLQEGQRGLCFVRGRYGDQVVLTSYGRASGFAVDPIEKKPLYHYLPGSRILSFGTAGCNLSCRFCQNWDMSRSREMDRLQARATPEELAQMARQHGCRSVAYTYNDPVIFLEYATDTARACHEAGIRSVAVTAGYINPGAREDFFAPMDAANVDLKSFDEAFYWKLCGGHLEPVLETLRYLRRHTGIWLELTTLLIPGQNDDPAELDAMTRWVVETLGPDVPMHFTAFHPDWRMTDLPPTPPETLRHARRIARDNGVHHAYTGNVRDPEGSTTWCPACGAPLIRRDGYRILEMRLKPGGHCPDCGSVCAGVF
ncbi:pyruvate formate lyase activating enzyme [Ectothiorhodospira mobilis]|uniref:Pyruvate formate lyase activating enzyme n=1 Tax=Ectothiorhodospira mobilis TaxID=195064 RepID=A0A1I4S8U5_ECTMO|nr:AmmeMemoRadiSam system radical SAM enzyme [Ectothiorhodospira mobilis]SFM60724.1 pyruvate formate lyase activating enzyme [Ectothiorhodospira mobilis]